MFPIHHLSKDSSKPSAAVWLTAGFRDSHLNQVAVVPTHHNGTSLNPYNKQTGCFKCVVVMH